MLMKKLLPFNILFFSALFIFSVSGYSGSGISSGQGKKLINPGFLCQQINYLASDSMMGRNTPSRQLDSAAAYIAANFRAWGIQPWNGSYFQEFPICMKQLGDTNDLTIIHPGGTIGMKLKSDYVPYDFSASNPVTGPVVFAGYGITAPEYKYDDYQGMDAKGKIVLVFKNEPQRDDSNSVFKGTTDTKYVSLKVKMKNAIAHGAIGMLVVNGPLQYSSVKARGYPWPSLSKVIPKDAVPWELCMDNDDQIPAIHIGEEVIRQLLGNLDSLKYLQEKIDKNLTPVSFLIPGTNVRMHANILTDIRTVKNVIGYLPGTDPVLSKQMLIIGAHYDHVGYLKEHKEGEDFIFNGADDNASGTSGVMAVAHAFSQMKKKSRRSILFMCFAGEEKGLFGSRYYTTHPLYPLAATVAMLNMDMISRNDPDSLYLEGALQSPDITQIFQEENKKTKFTLVVKQNEFLGGSDHYNFYKHNVPFAYAFTGLHKDYHQVGDNPDKADCEKAAKVSRLVLFSAYRIANEDQRYCIVPLENDEPLGE